MNADMIISDLRERLQQRRGSYASVAKHADLSVSWISKFATGVKDDPKIKTLVALDNALSAMDADDAHTNDASADSREQAA